MIPIIEKTNNKDEFLINCKHDDLILISEGKYRGSPLEYLTTKQSHPHLDPSFAKSCNSFIKVHKEFIHNEITKALKEGYKYIIVRITMLEWGKNIDERDALPVCDDVFDDLLD